MIYLISSTMIFFQESLTGHMEIRVQNLIQHITYNASAPLKNCLAKSHMKQTRCMNKLYLLRKFKRLLKTSFNLRSIYNL